MKKVILALVFALVTCFSLGLYACSNGKTELAKELPQEVVCGSEIYFKEYLPIDFESEYEMTVSYFDCTRLEQVNDKVVDSLMFRFSDVSKYDFKLNKVGAEPITFSINSVPVVPELLETSDWQTDKGETVLIEDLAFWCNITLEDEAAKIDPTYKLEFVDVQINSVAVDSSSTSENLSGQNSYTFETEAEYIFTIKASNISGEHITKVTVNTTNLENHTDVVCGYVFDESDTVEFEVANFESFKVPANNESIRVRVGSEKYDAVYSASSNSFKVSNFTQNLEVGAEEKLYLADKDGAAYSVNIVVPDLVVTKDNFKELELVKDGTIILAEDIDMNEIENYGSSRDGQTYSDYWFRGIFDGRGHTISNYSTKTGSYVGSLFWSVEGSTIKNLIFKNATVLANSSVVSGRTKDDSKFINIALEVNQLTTTNAAAISGPSESRIYYEDCLIFVKEGVGANVVKSGIVGGLYCRSVEFNNAYLVSSVVGLPIASEGHAGIVPVINGQYEKLKLSEAKAKYDENFDWGTDLLNKGAKMFFDGITVPDESEEPEIPVITDGKVNSSNIMALQTVTTGDFVLTEDIDMAGKVWVPGSTFSGTFDGNGYKISNLDGSLFKALSNAKISNLILDNLSNPAKGVFCTDNIGSDVEISNVVVKVSSAAAVRISLLGYQTGGTATIKNVVVDMFAFEKDKDYKGFLTCHAGGKQVLENVYCIGGNGSLHSIIGNSTAAAFQPSYFKADGETTAVENTDYFIYADADAFTGSSQFGAIDQSFKALVDKVYTTGQINQENIDILLTATTGDYFLVEDIDLSGKAWAPTATFSGTLNGNGHKISNLTGTLFNTIDGATICNLILDNVTSTANGVLCSAQLKKDVMIENVIVEVTSATAPRTSLLGIQVSGKATLKNVVVDMFAFESNSGYKGFLTTNAGAASILENAYFVGGNGTLHAVTGANAAYIPSYFKADGETTAVENTDYFIYADISAFTSSSQFSAIDQTFKALVDKVYTAGSTVPSGTQINQENIDILLTATTGDYVLVEDIDLSGKTWAPTATFSGTLNGNGHKISNLTGTLFNTIDGATICNLILDNVTSTANGVLCSAQLKKDVMIENVIVEVTSATAPRTSLLGIQVSGKATLKNVVVDMFAFESDSGYKGFLTTNAGAVSILENAYFVGGNGTLHAVTGANANYVPSYFKADGETTAVENTDYFIYAEATDFTGSNSIDNLDAEFKAMVCSYYNIVK